MLTPAQEFGFTPGQAQILIDQAFNFVDAGDLDAAAIVFTGLIELNPLDAGMRAALGSVLHQQGKLHAARAAYDEALRLDEDAILARVNRGEIRCQAGDLGGIDDLRHAAAKPSPVRDRATRLLRLYAR